MEGTHGPADGGDSGRPAAEQPTDDPHRGDRELIDSPPADPVDLTEHREAVHTELVNGQGTKRSAEQVEALARRLSLGRTSPRARGEARPGAFARHRERAETLKDAALGYDALGESTDDVRVAADSLRAWQTAEAVTHDAREAHELVAEVAAAMGSWDVAAYHRGTAETLHRTVRRG
jgi:hypothetical protein